MNFSSLIRTFNRLSLPKKLAAGVAAIAGGVALVSIPLLSMQPPSPPSTFNEEAYYKNRMGDRPSSAGNSTATGNSTTPLDATTTPDLPPLSGNVDIPGISSSPSSSGTTTLDGKTAGTTTLDGTTGNSIKIDATDTPTEDIKQNPSSNAPAGNASGINDPPVNPYAGTSGLSRFTSPRSISNSPYKATPGSTTLRTPYSQPNSIGTSSALPNSLQPGAGNSFSDLNPFDQNTPGGNTGSNAAIAPGTPGTLPNQSIGAPGNLDSSSPNVAPPVNPSNNSNYNPGR